MWSDIICGILKSLFPLTSHQLLFKKMQNTKYIMNDYLTNNHGKL
jgi:hypothetical protein